MRDETRAALAAAACGVGFGTLVAVALWRGPWSGRRGRVVVTGAKEFTRDAPKLLRREMQLRAAEREGRIRAEQALREATLRCDVLDARGGLGPPIATVHSCFSRRNGTPRQGGALVPSARCVVALEPHLPRDLLAGLEEYSHVWVIYVFHANTNIASGDRGGEGEEEEEEATEEGGGDGGDDDARMMRDSKKKSRRTNRNRRRHGHNVKAKVRVPRLNGEPVGALATRTPHRPLPVGLSIARVIAVDVDAKTLTLGGADLVDGTPVLDVKARSILHRSPYDRVRVVNVVPLGLYLPAFLSAHHPTVSIPDTPRRLSTPADAFELHPDVASYGPSTPKPYAPFCDCVPDATAPPWVNAVATDRDEPLRIDAVASSARADAEVGAAYEASVKERRRIRLEREGPESGMKQRSGGGGRKKSPAAAAASVDPETRKRLKREAKELRRSGLAPPDALYASGAAFVEMVKEVLALDMRAARERVAAADAKKFDVYRVTLCDVEVTYVVDEASKTVTMTGGRAVPPLDNPGVSAKTTRGGDDEEEEEEEEVAKRRWKVAGGVAKVGVGMAADEELEFDEQTEWRKAGTAAWISANASKKE